MRDHKGAKVKNLKPKLCPATLLVESGANNARVMESTHRSGNQVICNNTVTASGQKHLLND